MLNEALLRQISDTGELLGLDEAVLRDKPLWKQRYEEFIEAMVYDNRNALPYDQAINTLEGISTNVIATL
ncbi:MAG: hypothetical protein K0R24_979 [Gammaproteobacteria bacterium]|jgi:hypothetical protein|nr:hypothetical protein [Gammaproteobacteria bacterium]MCE3237998.1 hypothetical protein [Gammaproteobacteria bacterium]